MDRKIAYVFAVFLAAALVVAGCGKEGGHGTGTGGGAGDGTGDGTGGGAGMGGGMGGHHEEGMDEHHDAAMDEHGQMMQKQHESMVTLQQEWLKAKEAVESGDVSGAAQAASEMDKAAALQDEFMLHKKPESREEFLKKAMEFRRMVMGFKSYAEKGDLKSLKETAPKIDEACNSCHGTFR